MNDKPVMQGPASLLFGEAPPQDFDKRAEELFSPASDVVSARLDILEKRLNEICDFLVWHRSMWASEFPINYIHRFTPTGEKK